MTFEIADFRGFTSDKFSEKIASLVPDGQQERAKAVVRRFLTREEEPDRFVSFDLHLKTAEGARYIRLWQNLMNDSIQYTEYDELSGAFVTYKLDNNEDRGFTEIQNEGTMGKVLQRIALLLTLENVTFSKRLKDSRNLGPYTSPASAEAKPITPEMQLPLDVEKYLEMNREGYLEMAKKQNKAVVISRTENNAPASMIFFPDGITAIHLKSDDFSPLGSAKKKKDAVLIDAEGGRRRVARLVADVTASYQMTGALNELDALQFVQKVAHQEILYKWRRGTNKRGKETYTFYVENFSGGSVQSYLKKGGIEKSEKIGIATGLIKSLYEQHAVGLVHGDVRLRNALYSPRRGKAVFGDLDLSEKTIDKEKKAEDIWQLGLILYELLIGPYDKDEPMRTILRHLNPSDPTHKLIIDMLQSKPEKRPDMVSV